MEDELVKMKMAVIPADSMKAVTVIPSIATVADGTRW